MMLRLHHIFRNVALKTPSHPADASVRTVTYLYIYLRSYWVPLAPVTGARTPSRSVPGSVCTVRAADVWPRLQQSSQLRVYLFILLIIFFKPGPPVRVLGMADSTLTDRTDRLF